MLTRGKIDAVFAAFTAHGPGRRDAPFRPRCGAGMQVLALHDDVSRLACAAAGVAVLHLQPLLLPDK
jgi:ribosomal protein S27AE